MVDVDVLDEGLHLRALLDLLLGHRLGHLFCWLCLGWTDFGLLFIRGERDMDACYV